jgi:hypothetical protein
VTQNEPGGIVALATEAQQTLGNSIAGITCVTEAI